MTDVLRAPTSVPVDRALGRLNAVEAHNAPPKLFACGDLSLLKTGLRVSVVGTRNPSPAGRARAVKLARLLVANEITVVSGLAKGIDAEAHRATIESGGRTIAVLGTPLDRFYPAENRALQQLIMKEHLAVSQFAPGTRTHRRHFPQRNRLMALISDATVVVEAGASSGTESQAWEALRLGRLLYVTKSLAENPDVGWVQTVREYGAQILENGSDDLIEALLLPEADLSAAAAW